MPLHVQVIGNPPSFLLGLTQNFGVNARSIVKSRQILVENSIEKLRSKKNNNSVTLQQELDSCQTCIKNVPHMQCYILIKIMHKLKNRLTES
ncbi:hypothetical protein R3W88_002282 [Solanum pinnatisectum]|uniref:Uncharacterized protein n=1 Tax=Solanum pinnatisectum TaxID=50273 RepID=A0AAV9MND4_9SOLN|nr:hypothetical protein R3W88_002282 [Solanum pinnatisectum]